MTSLKNLLQQRSALQAFYSFRLRLSYIAAQSRFANTRCTSNNGPSLWPLLAWFAHIFLRFLAIIIKKYLKNKSLMLMQVFQGHGR